ncbi:MAG: uL15m family ribosomal protein [Candidatus Micrarchaeia archaeon]
MVVTHKRKSRRRLGNRRWGRGNVKKGRGSGCRGGVGRAGALKHKKTYTYKYERDRYGVHGFVNKTRAEENVINLTQISRMIAAGKVEKKDNVYYFKFDGKVLGGGQLFFPVIVEARSFSKGAIDKIEQVGGEARKVSPDASQVTQ